MLDDSSQGAGVLHATVSEGVVWFTRNSEAPRSFNRPAADFADSHYCRGVRELRILAMAQNAGLIAAAFPAARARGYKVLLASPLLVATRASRNNPRHALTRSVELAAPGSCPPASTGGWHAMQADERLVYAALARLLEGASASELPPILSAHPLWRRLMFVEPCDEAAVARIVASVRDPRWFVSMAAPDKLRGLYNFMGFDARRPDGAALERKALTASAWHLPDRVAPGASRQPRGFLWRHYYKLKAAGGGDGAEDRTSRLLLRFIRNVWLGVIAEAAGGPGDGLFVPEYFFDWSLEAGGVKDPFAATAAKAYIDFVAESAAPSGV